MRLSRRSRPGSRARRGRDRTRRRTKSLMPRPPVASRRRGASSSDRRRGRPLPHGTPPASSTTTVSAIRRTSGRFCSTSRIGVVRATSARTSATSVTSLGRALRRLVDEQQGVVAGGPARGDHLLLSTGERPARCARATRSGKSCATIGRLGALLGVDQPEVLARSARRRPHGPRGRNRSRLDDDPCRRLGLDLLACSRSDRSAGQAR